MSILRIGSTGGLVVKLQVRLNELGFPCGKPDGLFGQGTDIAVKAYQKSNGLLPDGVVGAITQKALGLLDANSVVEPLDHTKYFTVDFVKTLFPHTPVANISKNLDGVLDGLRHFKLVSAPMILMALGTIRAEVEMFMPIAEMKSKYNTSPNGKLFDLYDNRKDIGNSGPPDGSSYKGRGYVQLTGRSNYIKYGKILGIDLERNPDLACDTKYAGLILAAFISDVSDKVKRDLLEGDLKGARKLVNGGSHGLDRFSETYTLGIKSLPADLIPEYRVHI